MADRATREAFGETLVELVEEGLDVVAVDADLAGSTTTAKLGAAHPDRFYDVGIAEQDMIGIASGLALTGRIAFTGSFSVFGTGRCYDQIRNTVCDSMLDVKVCPTHSGVTVGEDGATHQMLEDITLMRALPPMRVLVPADYHAAKAAIRLAATTPGPVYVRLGRHKVPEVYDGGFVGGIPFAGVVRAGTDVTLAACGVEVAQAVAAADLLSERGISAEVVDVFSVKPLDEDVICASAAKTGHVVTCEEHSVFGGMGSAVAETLARAIPTPQAFVGMTGFGTSGPGDELIHHFGLDAAAIAEAAERLLATSSR
ncbi:MAG: transketolase family protein [Atopobiaceae bacterium]|jgi:transketolase|nr:transketolase family protein [Atopobiaceae bacterium]